MRRLLASSFLLLAFQSAAIAQGTVPEPEPQSSAAPVSIQVDLARTTGPFKPAYSWFGYDEANYTTMRHGKELLKELHDLSPVPVYIRAHHLLTSGDGKAELKFSSTNVYTEDANGKPVYDFTILDGIFDAYKAAGVRPMVELGFMPEALAADLPNRHEPYQVHYPKSTISGKSNNPPKDYAKWGELARVVAAHLVERYGRETVLQWYFEVWNEPDIDYWHGTPQEYDRLYDVSAAAVRKVLPRAKIGGPDSTGVYAGTGGASKSEAFLRQFLTHCAQGKNAATGGTGAPLDFISFHPKGSPKFVDGHVVMNVGQQLAAVERGMEVVASYPAWRNTPIVLGESDPEGCAACQGAQNGYRNGPLYGVSVAEATARTWELARKHGVRVQGAVTWAFTFENQAYFAGFRELATNGVDKAVLNVFRMMAMLGGEWVRTESTGALPVEQIVTSSVTHAPDVDAVATRRPGEVDVLLWNYHDADLPAAPAKVAMDVRGLPRAQVSEEIFLMDAAHSNAYAVWQRMGSPEQPSAAQRQELVRAGKLQRVAAPHALAVKDGDATLQMSLARQGVALVRLRWQ